MVKNRQFKTGTPKFVLFFCWKNAQNRCGFKFWNRFLSIFTGLHRSSSKSVKKASATEKKCPTLQGIVCTMQKVAFFTFFIYFSLLQIDLNCFFSFFLRGKKGPKIGQKSESSPAFYHFEKMDKKLKDISKNRPKNRPKKRQKWTEIWHFFSPMPLTTRAFILFLFLNSKRIQYFWNFSMNIFCSRTVGFSLFTFLIFFMAEFSFNPGENLAKNRPIFHNWPIFGLKII